MMAIFRKAVTVKRQAAGAYVAGVWVPGAASQVTIQASVQPASAEDMQRLPEGQRQTGAVKLYTSDTLLTSIGDQKADVVVTEQGEYEVSVADVWNNGLIPHKAYLCARVVDAETRTVAVLFVPVGSDSLITSDGLTFKVVG